MKTVWNIALGFLVLSSPGATVAQGHRLPDQKAVQHLERLLVTEADSRAGSDTAKNRADRLVTVSGSGPDITLEYRMRVLSDKMHVSQMQMQAIMYADAASGMGRVESIMRLPMMGEMKTILLTNTGKPGEIIVLNEKKREFAVVDQAMMNHKRQQPEFSVRVLGDEVIGGLHCRHIQASTTGGQRFDIWTSQDIPGYEKMRDLYVQSLKAGSDKLWKDIKEAGAGGFLVRLLVTSGGSSSVMELSRIERSDLPGALFEIPEGYREGKGGLKDVLKW